MFRALSGSVTVHVYGFFPLSLSDGIPKTCFVIFGMLSSIFERSKSGKSENCTAKIQFPCSSGRVFEVGCGMINPFSARSEKTGASAKGGSVIKYSNTIPSPSMCLCFGYASSSTTSGQVVTVGQSINGWRYLLRACCPWSEGSFFLKVKRRY